MLLLARADGQPLQVIAHDGHLLAAPRPHGGGPAHSGPASRSAARARSRPHRRAAAQAVQSGRPARAFAAGTAVQRYARQPERPAAAWPARLAQVERLDAKDVAVRRRFSMAMAFLAPDGQGQLAPIDARLGDLELWDITNVDTQDHVFHLHTWPFQVWRWDGAALSDPGWRDTINLVPGRAGRDPDTIPRLRRTQRLPLPHRRAWRRRDDGDHRGAWARQRARRSTVPGLRLRDLPLRVMPELNEWQAGIRIGRDQPAVAQLAEPVALAVAARPAVRGARRAAPTSAAA